MFVERCVFYDGVHYGPEGCAHERTEDELGPVMPDGWTVQQGPPPVPTTDSDI